MGMKTTAAGLAIIALAPGAAYAKIYTCNQQGTIPDGGTGCAGAAGYQSAEPRYGSPNSMQFQNASVALDLFDIQPEGAEAFTPEGDSDTIGGAFTYDKAGFQTGKRLDLHYQHARRLGEGTRARLLIDVPVSINHADADHYRWHHRQQHDGNDGLADDDDSDH